MFSATLWNLNIIELSWILNLKLVTQNLENHTTYENTDFPSVNNLIEEKNVHENALKIISLFVNF